MAYFFMGGPGADPHCNGGTSEAYSWGQTEAKYALAQRLPAFGMKVVFMDMEDPGGGEYDGWNQRVNSCGALVQSTGIPVAVDRSTFDGFFDYVKSKGYTPGVYSSPAFWSETFAGSSSGSIPNTTEWTYENTTYNQPSPGPVGFSRSGQSAQWLGGVNSSHEFAWPVEHRPRRLRQFDANHS